MNNKFKIAGLGEILWDIYGEQKYLGGAPANFAAHVGQAGHEGIILSRIGNDALGQELLAKLGSMDLNSAGIQVDQTKPTGTVHVFLDEKGVPRFDCSRDVAFDNLQFDASWKNLAEQLDAVLFGTLAQRQLPSRQAIQSFLRAAPQAVKVFDINLRGWNDETRQIVDDSLHLSDVIKLNEEELRQLKKALTSSDEDVFFLRRLLQKYQLKLAAVTLGEKGCFLVTESEFVRHPGFAVDMVDTTGSGDAFTAGLMVKLLQKAPLAEMAEFANRLGAFVATQKGAVPRWTVEDIRSILSPQERGRV